MIEVEKSFDPNAEQLAHILDGAEFLGEVINHDVYYDYPDLRMAKKKIKLRFRNGTPELKIEKSETVDNEIEDEEEIKQFFDIQIPLKEFIKNELIEIINYKNIRRKYTKDGINIDVDNLDFGMQSCDFEVMVHDVSDIPHAEEKIFTFARAHGLDPMIENIGKRRAYLQKFKPDIYKAIYGEK